MKIDCVHGTRKVHLKHESKSLEMFNHFRYMKSNGIICHCDICEYTIRYIRAYENGDPYLSVKMITYPRRYGKLTKEAIWRIKKENKK